MVFRRNSNKGEVVAQVFGIDATGELPADRPDVNLFRWVCNTGDVIEGAVGEPVERCGVCS